MYANDMKDGMAIKMTHGREGHCRDNKRGIIRVVEVPVFGGQQGTDVGSCYVDEILKIQDFEGEWHAMELTKAHKKTLIDIRNEGW